MLRSVALLLLVISVGCKPTDSPPDGTRQTHTTERSAEAHEIPVWKFGKASIRTDPLPAELDTMAAWGEYYDGEKPAVTGIDLNVDGNNEWFVRGNDSVCGRVGCPVALLTRRADGKFTDILQSLAREVYVTTRHVNGWPVLWIEVGGSGAGIYRLEFRSGKYDVIGSIALANPDWAAVPDSILRLIESAPSK